MIEKLKYSFLKKQINPWSREEYALSYKLNPSFGHDSKGYHLSYRLGALVFDSKLRSITYNASFNFF